MPPGDFFLQIARLTLAVHCADERVAWQWDEPVSRFLTPPAAADLDLDVRLFDDAPPPRGELLFDSQAVWRIHRDGDGYRIDCHSEMFGAQPYKIATLDESFARGTIALRGDLLPLALNPLDYPLDEVLVANLLARRGAGVELHSCGIVDREGRGHLFVGVSGAGKSTTAGLWEGEAAAVVSDDRVIVREERGAMWMYGTPWHGEAALSLPDGVPLAGVYLLTQASAHALVELPRAAAVARLFGCTFPLFYDAPALDFTVSFLERICDAVPVRELRFARDRGAVELVRSATRVR
ncbi:MAG TPA: hypothetical protein VF824_00745 [Thermoanaerobaculia bacterium]